MSKTLNPQGHDRPNKFPSGGLMLLKSPIKMTKLHGNAQDLFKERPTNIGWSVTLIGRVDNRVEDVTGELNYFSTGIKVSPPEGYYLELVAKKELYKAGYMLPSGYTILDPDEEEELVVPLYKFKDGEDLEIPFSGVQLVVRQAEYSAVMTEGGQDKPTTKNTPLVLTKLDEHLRTKNKPKTRAKNNHMF